MHACNKHAASSSAATLSSSSRQQRRHHCFRPHLQNLPNCSLVFYCIFCTTTSLNQNQYQSTLLQAFKKYNQASNLPRVSTMASNYTSIHPIHTTVVAIAAPFLHQKEFFNKYRFLARVNVPSWPDSVSGYVSEKFFFLMFFKCFYLIFFACVMDAGNDFSSFMLTF